MNKFYTLTLSILLLLGSASAQLSPALPSDSAQTLDVLFRKKFEANRILAEQIAAEKNIKLRRVTPNGQVIEFETFDANGNMLFRTTTNVGAGRTISTNRVWPGGTVGTALTGVVSGNRLGIWDGGATLVSHQEFGTRATQVDGATQLSDHATHVAGTMVGAGVSANARGMAYEANLRCYDWNNDESEMASAGSNGMLVSNHSYGTITGWYFDGADDIWYGDPGVSLTTDYKFGFYDSQAAQWDLIAFNNPFYLICKAAGNDRGEDRSSSTWFYADGTPGSGTPPGQDGGTNGYDCLPTYSTAKNVLTVGAVRKINNNNTNNGWTQISDVVMSTFSGWGPTDDGRIKPDVVGCGVNVFSAGSASTTNYTTKNGTSMASPNVSGSLLLVQQHFSNLKNRYLRASTLKGLTIHTADEAGNVGPDYVYGWGLVNIAKAVQLITDSNQNSIQERTLTNGASFTQNIVANGNMPLRITICWTDRAGTPVAPALNPTNRMLVNDLDIRLTRVSDNTVFSPYILNPATPNIAATTGDNIRDNVEQIYLATPAAGAYTLSVTHKGVLVGSTQTYSIIISGLVANPSASFAVNNRFPCTTQSVTFTDLSTGGISSRVWSFPGGNPSTSTAANPVVSYSVAGRYSVALKVTNALGTDSVFFTNFITSGGNTLPFTETFEDNSNTRSQWTIQNTNNDTTWRLATIGGTTPGDKAYCMPFFNYTNTGRRDGLLTPVLSLRSYTNPVLTFSHAHALFPGNAHDSLVIWISTNCGSSWVRLASYRGPTLATAPDTSEEFYPQSASEWCSTNCKTISLNAYSGLSNIRIRFEGYNNYGNNLFIDNVNIFGTPLAPVAGFRASKTNLCTNESIQLTDTSRNFPTAWNWEITGPQNFNFTTQNPIVAFAQPGQYTVKLRVSNSTASDSVTRINYFTVIQGPATPNITTNSSIICDGDSIQLATDSTASQYQWFRNNSVINGATSSTYFAKITGTYRLRTTAANGCNMFTDTIGATLFDKPAKPTISSSLSGSVMCEGGTAVLTSSALLGNIWYRSGNAISGGTIRQLTIQDSGIYTVQVNANGCYSELADARTVNLIPRPQTSAISGVASVLPNSTHTYSVNLTAGSTYNWQVSGGIPSGGGNTMSVTWGNGPTGNISVRETGANGCQGELKSQAITISLTALRSTEKLTMNLQVYPNPASDFIDLQWNANAAQQMKIQLINILGQEVYVMEAISVAGENKLKIELPKLNKGVYYLQLTTWDGMKEVRKITIE
jgi:PKD repeat protein